MTTDEFDQYLRGLGYSVEVITGMDDLPYSVVRDVHLPSGALKGRSCDVALHRTGATPFVPPSAIHTRPHLVPMNSGEPLKTLKSGIGPEWQYWSRRYDRPPTPKALWAHVLTVLCDDRWPTS